MTPSVRLVRAGLLVLVLLPMVTVTGWAGESKSQFSIGANSFSVSPPCPVKQFPTFESIAPVPSIVDPFEQDLIPFFCQIDVQREGKGVKGAKGKYESELVVRNNNTGEVETHSLGSGRFRTNKEGRAAFDFDLPSELFADGFESGDVSAWSYTRTDFTNRKRGNQAGVQCGGSTSRSQNTTWVRPEQ